SVEDMMGCYMYIFFFQKRRRQTILVSDWSSDVCSSDLRLRLSRERDARRGGTGSCASHWHSSDAGDVEGSSRLRAVPEGSGRFDLRLGSPHCYCGELPESESRSKFPRSPESIGRNGKSHHSRPQTLYRPCGRIQ